jgi:hypothetical protein
MIDNEESKEIVAHQKSVIVVHWSSYKKHTIPETEAADKTREPPQIWPSKGGPKDYISKV